MNIAYSCNDYYIPQTGISLISLLENNKDVEEITIYLISKDITNQNIAILKCICEQYDRHFINIPFDKIAYDLRLSDTGRHIETIYSKIFFPRIIGLNKCLYIDSDTIINGKLDELWSIDLTGKYLAAAETYTTKYQKLLDIPSNNFFFNDGVTLVNVDYCREMNLVERAIQFINSHNGNPPVLSEGTLNAICHSNIVIMSLRYNMMSGIYQIGMENPKFLASITRYEQSDIVASCKEPIIIHYLSGYYNRPWAESCTHPLKDIFIKYKSISPWKDDILNSSPLSARQKILKLVGRILGFSNLLKLHRLKQKYT